MFGFVNMILIAIFISCYVLFFTYFQKPDLMHALSHCMLEPVEYARVVQYDLHYMTYLRRASGWRTMCQIY